MPDYSLSGSPDIAIIGATGAVGQTILKILEEREFPYQDLVPVASERSKGKKVQTDDGPKKIVTLGEVDWSGVDLALMSAGSDLSASATPELVEEEVLVVDNSSAFRLRDGTPLVVPEVNWSPEVLDRNPIANPNCSATQLVMVLKPILDQFGLEYCSVATYQSVSGAGGGAVEEFKQQKNRDGESSESHTPTEQFRDPIPGNVLPFIPHGKSDGVSFGDHTGEEKKVKAESRKILREPDLRISVTCARVPVEVCHAQAIHLSLSIPNPEPASIRACLQKFPGVVPVEDENQANYPQPRNRAGTDPVFVGRIRRDPDLENGIALWSVGDNLRKGAALNTVQIAEHFLK